MCQYRIVHCKSPSNNGRQIYVHHKTIEIPNDYDFEKNSPITIRYMDFSNCECKLCILQPRRNTKGAKRLSLQTFSTSWIFSYQRSPTNCRTILFQLQNLPSSKKSERKDKERESYKSISSAESISKCKTKGTSATNETGKNIRNCSWSIYSLPFAYINVVYSNVCNL